MKNFHLHTVSDSTGETVSSVARAAMIQFDGIDVEEHAWSLVRTKGQLDRVLDGIRRNPGFVMYTIADRTLRKYFKKELITLNVPSISVLSRVISDLSTYFGAKATVFESGKIHEMDEDYFSRVEAINFALNHDDGQSTSDLERADIVLVGVSRTSKSPTSMYLAFKGYRAANVPFVPGIPLPEIIETLENPMIVGLTLNPESLRYIRKSRLLSISESGETDYTDFEVIKKELIEAKKLFLKNKWPFIDVSRKSVEETAAKIIQIYEKEKKNGKK